MKTTGWTAEAWAGFRDAATVAPSVVAYSAVWGGLARQHGLSLGEVVAMCLLVSAGTAQFVALPTLSGGTPAWLVVVTTYIVNLRHYLMAASLAPCSAGPSRWRLALLAHGVSDEVYALAQARFARHPARAAYFAGCAAARPTRSSSPWGRGRVGSAVLVGAMPPGGSGFRGSPGSSGIREQALGRYSLEVARTLEGLAAVLRATHRNAEAASLSARAQEIRTRRGSPLGAP